MRAAGCPGQVAILLLHRIALLDQTRITRFRVPVIALRSLSQATLLRRPLALLRPLRPWEGGNLNHPQINRQGRA